MSQAAVASPAQADTTQFDMSSAVPETEDGKAVSAMPAFDLSSAVPEDQISRAEPKSWQDQALNFLTTPFRKSPEDRQAEAMNIYAISKSTGMSMEDVSKNYDQLSRNPKVTGMMPEPTKGQYMGAMMTEAMIPSAPLLLTTQGIVGLGVFTGINKLLDMAEDEYLPKDTNQGTKDLLDIGKLAAGAVGAHGAVGAVERGVDGLVDSLMGDVMPHPVDAVPTMDLAAEHIKAITDSKLPDEAKQDLLGRLGVTQDHIDASVASGKPIRVPFTNVINMAQSPHWDDVAGEITENGLPKTGIETPEVKAVLSGEASPDNIPNAEGEQQGNFGKGQSPLLLDYLAQYLPPKVIASLTNDERLKLANGPWQDLRDFASQFEGEKNLGVKGPDYYKNLMLKGELNGYFSGEEEGGKGKVKNTSNVSLAEVEKQVRSLDTENLESLMDTRYEAGASQKELDFLENIYAERMSEEEPNVSEDNEPSLEGNGRYGVDLESQLESFYSQFKLPVNARDGQYTNKELMTNIRENLKAHGDLKDVSDEDIVNAAKDVAEWKEKLNERRAAKGEPIVESKVEAEKPISPMTGGLQEETGKFGEHNTLFTEQMANEARAAINSKLSGLHSGVDPTIIGDMLKVGGYHFEGGVREFGKWSEKMINDLGENVKPYLQQVWDGLQKEAPKMAQPKVEATEDELSKQKYFPLEKLGIKKIVSSKTGEVDLNRSGKDMRERYLGTMNERMQRVFDLKDDIKTLEKDKAQREGQFINAGFNGDVEKTKEWIAKLDAEIKDEDRQYWEKVVKPAAEASLNLSEGAKEGITLGNQYFREAGLAMKSVGAIRTFLENYGINRLYEPDSAEKVLKGNEFDNPQQSTGHAKQRVFENPLEAVLYGKRFKTMDYADLIGIHGEEAAAVTTGRQFVQETVPEELTAWTDRKKVPAGWSQVGNMERDIPMKDEKTGELILDKDGNQDIKHQVLVAPKEIADIMGVITDPDNLKKVNAYQKVQAVNNFTKSFNVMIGLFHDRNFVEQKLFSPGGIKALTNTFGGNLRSLMGKDDWRQGRLRFLKNGGMLGSLSTNIDVLKPTSEEGTEGQNWLKKIEKMPIIKGATALVEWHRDNLFDVMGSYYKVDSYMKREAMWDLKNPNATEDERTEAMRGYARASNNDFGGQSWFARGFNKTTMSVARLFSFAPDWLYSAFRTAKTAAIDWKGIAGSQGTEGGAARALLIKQFMYATAATQAANYAITGHFTDKNTKGNEWSVELNKNIHISLYAAGLGELVKLASDVGNNGWLTGLGQYLKGKASPIIRFVSTFVSHTNYHNQDITKETGNIGGQIAKVVPEEYRDDVAKQINYVNELASTIAPVPFAVDPGNVGYIADQVKDAMAGKKADIAGSLMLPTVLAKFSAGESPERQQQDIDTEVEKGLKNKDDTAANKYLASGDISQAKIDELQTKADETPLEKSYKSLSVEKIMKKADGNIDSMDADDKDSLKTMLNDKYDRMVSANKASPNEIKRIGDLLEDFYDKHKIQ